MFGNIQEVNEINFKNNDKRQRPVHHSWLISLLNWLKNGAEKSTKLGAGCPT